MSSAKRVMGYTASHETRTLARRALTTAVVVALVCTGSALAQTVVLQGGTVHPVSRNSFQGSVRIEDGLIKEVGASVDTSGAEVVDISGLHVYPGLFDSMSALGLVEISSISATVDTTEIGKYNPHLQALTAVHPASEVIPVTRANGITHAITAPSAGGGRGGGNAGVIPGQASLIHLDGWTVEEMVIDADAAMILSWPQLQTRRFDFTTFTVVSTNYEEAKKKAEEAQEELRRWLDAARHYAKAIDAVTARAERDLRLEALAGILDGQQQVVVFANGKRDIEAAVEFAEEQGLRIVIAGARDAWQVKEMLAEKGIPVILGQTQSLPNEEDDPYDRPFRTAGELVAAGVTVAFSSGAGGGFGPGGPHASRTLPYEAAMAVPYGLSREAALRAITLTPAEIFGVDDKLGSIDSGKIANLIVTDGDPLEITTEVKRLYIQGREVSTQNRHRALWERYRSRPESTESRP